MKKALSIVITLIMVMSLAVGVFAVDGSVTYSTGDSSWTASNTQDVTVPADFDQSGFDATAVTANYYVEVSWTVNSTLKYTIKSSDYTWNIYDSTEKKSTESGFTAADKAGYEGDGDWSGQATISVTVNNWSNRPVKAEFSYADAAVGGNVTKAINTEATGIRTMGAAIKLVSAANGVNPWDPAAASYVKTGSADAVVINAEAGRPAGGKSLMTGAINASDTVIGTLTITISDNTTVSP